MATGWVAAPSLPFDPVRCAHLHNQLLAKAIDASFPALGAPTAVRRDLVPRMREAAPSWPNHVHISEDSPLHHFLSLIDSYADTRLPLTPEMLQPHPIWFDSPMHDLYDGWNIILLYPENDQSEPMDSGLYFDLDTELVCWGRMQGYGLQDEAFWVPLEVALEEALYMWQRGKYTWDVERASNPSSALTIRGWVDADLRETIAAWDDLLDAIQARMPLADNPVSFEEPLPADLVDRYDIGSFAKAFLSTAKRPSFAVAPGITTFTPATFDALYSAEDPSSWRLSHFRDEVDFRNGALILPAASGPVAPNVGDANPHFDKDWGSAKKTVSRHAGLYTEHGFVGDHEDCVWLLTQAGRDEPFEHVGHMPWGRPRRPRLAEMLGHWAALVEGDIWDVGPGGVETSEKWFDEEETEMYRRMIWAAGAQLEGVDE